MNNKKILSFILTFSHVLDVFGICGNIRQNQGLIFLLLQKKLYLIVNYETFSSVSNTGTYDPKIVYENVKNNFESNRGEKNIFSKIQYL
jgi:hypothetical protein